MPAVEDGPRAPGENFYFIQEDFLRAGARVGRWTYTITRPHTFEPEWDIISSMAKAREYGFREAVGTRTMFARLFENYRFQKIVT